MKRLKLTAAALFAVLFAVLAPAAPAQATTTPTTGRFQVGQTMKLLTNVSITETSYDHHRGRTGNYVYQDFPTYTGQSSYGTILNGTVKVYLVIGCDGSGGGWK